MQGEGYGFYMPRFGALISCLFPFCAFLSFDLVHFDLILCCHVALCQKQHAGVFQKKKNRGQRLFILFHIVNESCIQCVGCIRCMLQD